MGDICIFIIFYCNDYSDGCHKRCSEIVRQTIESYFDLAGELASCSADTASEAGNAACRIRVVLWYVYPVRRAGKSAREH